MTDYTELVKALRRCAEPGTIIDECDTFDDCPYSLDGYCGDCMNNLVKDAAAAIEALQAENADIREELFISQRKYDEFTTIASMQNAMLAKQLPKRGEWKITTENFTPELICSKCGVHIPCVAGWCMDAHMNYCPNCGAKMEVQE